MFFLRDLRIAARSLRRTKGLAITVIVTLALGIGANAAIFTLVRDVLLKPLVNRDDGVSRLELLGVDEIGDPSDLVTTDASALARVAFPEERGVGVRAVVVCSAIVIHLHASNGSHRSWSSPRTLPSGSVTVATKRPPPTSCAGSCTVAPVATTAASVDSRSDTCQ